MSQASLAAAVRSKRLVVFAGSGFSQDAGLPSWQGLVRGLAANLADSGALHETMSAAVLAACDAGELQAAMQVLVATVSRREVSEQLRLLMTPVRESRVIRATSLWRPRGLLTTNFDRITEGAVGGTPYRLSNSEAELKLLSTAVGTNSPFIWKIHGDMDNALDPADPKVAAGGPFLVLSQADFAVLLQGDRGRQLLLGLHSVLQTFPVVFIGYSFADPDIQVLLKWLAENCQFAHPSWFVGIRGDKGMLPTNVRRLDAVQDWGELADWIEEIGAEAAQGAAPRAEVRTPPSPNELRAYLAVSRYLTDLSSPDISERVLASALFDEIVAVDDFKMAWLTTRVGEILGIGPQLAAALAEATADLLAAYGLVIRDGSTVLVQAAAAKIRGGAVETWQRERDAFYESLGRRLPRGAPPITRDRIGILEAILVDLCSELGETMAQWVSRGVGGVIGLPDISERIRHHLQADDENREVEALLRAVLGGPRDQEIPYLYRLLASTFLANTVRLNPVAATQLRQSMTLYELYLDSNVLLPLIVAEHPNHTSTKSVILESRSAGVTLRVLSPILNEVIAHREAARRDFRELNGDHLQLTELSSALGSRANVFLQGFLRAPATAQLGARLDWRDYLARYSDDTIVDLLAAFGVALVEPEPDASTGELYAEALTAIGREWLQKLTYQREPVLDAHEAVQLTQIYLRRERAPELRDHIWFLSNETVLQHVFERRPSRWVLPATFPYSAWVAFIDSRMPRVQDEPAAIVRAILMGRAEAFDLPTPLQLVRERAFGDRVPSRDEEDALLLATTDFALMKRVEEAQHAVFRRKHAPNSAKQLGAARREAAGEVSQALGAQIGRLQTELDLTKRRLVELESTTASVPKPASFRREPRRTKRKPQSRS